MAGQDAAKVCSCGYDSTPEDPCPQCRGTVPFVDPPVAQVADPVRMVPEEDLAIAHVENDRLRDALVVLLDAVDMHERDSDEFERAWRYARARLIDGDVDG